MSFINVFVIVFEPLMDCFVVCSTKRINVFYAFLAEAFVSVVVKLNWL